MFIPSDAKSSPTGHMLIFFAQHLMINPQASSGQLQRIIGCLFILFKIVKKEIKMTPYFAQQPEYYKKYVLTILKPETNMNIDLFL